MTKSADAFRTIREVADWLGVQTHVLRFWESKFGDISPVKGPGGRRYFRTEDITLLGGIKVLLHDRGMTIRGAQKMIEDSGADAVRAVSPELDFPQSAPQRSRTAPRNSANSGGTGQGGIYDLDALAGDPEPDGSPAPEAPMAHVTTPDAAPVPRADVADVIAFNADNARDAGQKPPDAAPHTAAVDAEPDSVPAQETAADMDTAAERMIHAARRARQQGRHWGVADRARLGIVTRRLRTLAGRVARDLDH
jgi:DNA-binding transcriptional MerR regulator